MAEPHEGLGRRLTDRGDFEEAVTEYRRAIRLAPELAEPHNGLRKALAAQESWPRRRPRPSGGWI